MNTLENELQTALINARSILGAAVPRLITERPQVAISGMTHGLTGQFTYLTGADLIAYASIAAGYFKDSQPVGTREIQMLQCIIDVGWRLSRIPQLSESLRHTTFTNQSRKISAAHPEVSPRSIEPHAEADAFRDSAHDFDILSRYETRLTRLLVTLSREYDRMRKYRTKFNGPGFHIEESDTYKIYVDLLAVARRLVEARRELIRKAQVTPEQVGTEMVGNFHVQIVQPLTKITRETLELARDWGLLNELERTLFPEVTVN